MAVTPEGKVKNAVKRVISDFEKNWGETVWQWWPVPSGYGESQLDCLIHFKGHSLWIETKANGKLPTPRQAFAIERIENAGVMVLVIGSVDAPGLETLKTWLISCIPNPKVQDQ